MKNASLLIVERDSSFSGTLRKTLSGIAVTAFLICLAHGAQAATETYTNLSDTTPGSNVPTSSGDDVQDNLSGATTSTLGATHDIIANGTNNFIVDGTAATGATLTLTGVNTYTGTTTLQNNGYLILSGGGSTIADSSSVIVNSGSTLYLNDAETITSLSGANGGAVSVQGGTLTLSNASGTFGGGSSSINGAGGLTISGGSETLTGSNNNFTGATTIASGATLLLTGVGSVYASSGVADAGTFDISGTTSGASIKSLSGAGGVNLGTETLTLTAASGNFSGAIAATAGNLVISGGTETLSGANLYTGSTTVGSGATLSITDETNISGSSGIALNAGTLQLGSTTTHSITQGIVLTGGGAINETSSDTGTISGIISGAGGLVVNNGTAGELILSGANTFTGGIMLDTGAISFTSGGTSGTNLGANAVTLQDGAELLANGTGQTISNNITLSASGGGTIGVANGDTDTFSGTIGSTGGLTVNSGTTGTVILSGNNTFSGGISVNGGTLSFTTGGASGTNLSANTVTLQNATLLANGTGQTISNALVLGTGGGTVNVANGDSDTFSGIVSGATGLSVNNGTAGTAILSGNNTFSGGVTVKGGTLSFTTGGASGTNLGANAVTLAGGALLANGTGQTISNAITLSTGGGTIDVANGDADTFTGTLSGTTALAINNGTTGTLIYDGTGSASGGTTVDGGTLEIGDSGTPSADLTSNVAVASAGTLRGHGTVTGNVINSGIVSPGGTIGTLTVTGNYTQNSSGTLAIELSPTQTSLLAVSGTATLAGTVSVTPDAGAYVRGARYVILTASNVIGSFSTLTDTAPLVQTFSILYNNDNVELYATGGGTANFIASAVTRNERNVASVLDTLSPSYTTGNFNYVMSEVALLSGSAQAQGLNELNGTIAADLQYSGASNMRLMMSSLQSRLVGSPAASGAQAPLQARAAGVQVADSSGKYMPVIRQPDNITAWMQGFGEFSNINGTSTSAGLSSTVGGGAAGVESRLGKNDRVGVMVGAAMNSIGAKDVPQTATQNTYAFGLYGSKGLAGIVFTGTLLGGYNSATTDRQIAVDNGQTAHGTTDGYSAGGDLGAGYPVTLADGTIITPNAGLTYTYTYINGYTESGASGANLDVGASRQSLLQTSLGATVSHEFKMTDWRQGKNTVVDTITPEVSAGWVHEALNPGTHVNEAFDGIAGSGFTSYSVTPKRDAAALGAGLAFTPGEASNVSVYGRYDTLLSSSENDQTVTAGFRYSW